MESVAVGAFNVQDIDIFYHLWVTQDCVPASTNVAREKIAKFFSVFFSYIQYHLRRAKDMARIAEGEFYALGN